MMSSMVDRGLTCEWVRLTLEVEMRRVWGKRKQGQSGVAERLIYVQTNNHSSQGGGAWPIDVCHEPSSHAGTSPATKGR